MNFLSFQHSELEKKLSFITYMCLHACIVKNVVLEVITFIYLAVSGLCCSEHIGWFALTLFSLSYIIQMLRGQF